MKMIDVNAQREFNRTALIVATTVQGIVNTVVGKLLEQDKVDANVRDDDCNTSLPYAC